MNRVDAYTSACLAGLGICQTPSVGVRADIVGGRLVEILPDFKAEPITMKIVYPERRMLAKRVRLFIDGFEPVLRQSL